MVSHCAPPLSLVQLEGEAVISVCGSVITVRLALAGREI
jgi:hypothetical protein